MMIEQDVIHDCRVDGCDEYAVCDTVCADHIVEKYEGSIVPETP